MALTASQIDRLRAAAEREGVDAGKLIEQAEKELANSPDAVVGGAVQEISGEQAAEGGRPTAERLLVGFLPYMRVSELRKHWLMLGDEPPVVDEHLTIAEWDKKHRAPQSGGGDGEE